MTEKFTRWDPVDQLQSGEDMALYLDACLDEVASLLGRERVQARLHAGIVRGTTARA